MAQPGLPRRDPSYRKPVPRYIPSPPPSPSLPMRTSFSSPYTEDDPPLPEDWRQVISKVTRPIATTATFGGTQTKRVNFPSWNLEPPSASPTSISPGRVIHSPKADKITFPPNSLQRMSQGESLVRLPRSASVSPLQSNTRRSKRGLHQEQEYRPPTPPLPAEYKKIKSPVIDSEWQFVDRIQEKGVYTDPTITLPSSVMTSPSIQTEKTWFGSNPSMTWTGGLTTCVALSDEGHPSYPTHALAPELCKPGAESQPVASSLPWWERVGMFGAFLKTTLTNASVILCGPRS